MTISMIGLLCLMLAQASSPSAPSQPIPINVLFERFQSEDVTDSASEQFLRFGTDNAEAAQYLAARLPSLIQEGPKKHPHVWLNSIRLAGAFRLSEAIPSLTQWIGTPVGTPRGFTLAEVENLDLHPAGKALSQIGAPSVQALSKVLEKGSKTERWVAYRALYLIGSPDAITLLRDHTAKEWDAELKASMQRALQVK